ncbi:MAG: SCO family protein [Bacteriovoracaceae bacterium]|nr:SCO family protein [Bacteriovoracaceae bacterium]
MKFFLLMMFFVLPVFSTVSSRSKSIYQLKHEWISQDNKKIKLEDLKGHLTVMSMIFTSCPKSCPLMVTQMKSFDHLLTKQEKKKIRYVGFSIDPERDTPVRLKEYAKKMSLDSRWNLFTSNANQVREMAAAVGFNYKDLGAGDFTHSKTLYLLSSEGEVLAYKEADHMDWKDWLEKIRKK